MHPQHYHQHTYPTNPHTTILLHFQHFVVLKKYTEQKTLLAFVLHEKNMTKKNKKNFEQVKNETLVKIWFPIGKLIYLKNKTVRNNSYTIQCIHTIYTYIHTYMYVCVWSTLVVMKMLNVYTWIRLKLKLKRKLKMKMRKRNAKIIWMCI